MKTRYTHPATGTVANLTRKIIGEKDMPESTVRLVVVGVHSNEYEVRQVFKDGAGSRLSTYRTLESATKAYGALTGRPNLYQEVLTGKIS